MEPTAKLGRGVTCVEAACFWSRPVVRRPLLTKLSEVRPCKPPWESVTPTAREPQATNLDEVLASRLCHLATVTESPLAGRSSVTIW